MLIAIGVDRVLRAIPRPATYTLVIAPLLFLTMFRAAVYRDVRDPLA